MSLPMLDEASLDDLYQWLDSLPLSRSRKNVARDYSDAGTVYYCTMNITKFFFYIEKFLYVESNYRLYEENYSCQLISARLIDKTSTD